MGGSSPAWGLLGREGGGAWLSRSGSVAKMLGLRGRVTQENNRFTFGTANGIPIMGIRILLAAKDKSPT